jgi:hypothetical protein
LSRQVHAPDLIPFDDQLQVLGKLRVGLENSRERADVLELLRILRARRDCYAATAAEIDSLLAIRRVGHLSEDGMWVWDGANWVPTHDSARQRATPHGTPTQGAATAAPPHTPATPAPPRQAASTISPAPTGRPVAIATILLMFCCGPGALVTVWFTRWSGRTKAMVALLTGVVWGVVILKLSGVQ